MVGGSHRCVHLHNSEVSGEEGTHALDLWELDSNVAELKTSALGVHFAMCMNAVEADRRLTAWNSF